VDKLSLDASGAFELRRNEAASDDNDITRSTLSSVFSLGDDIEGSWDVTNGDLVRSFLDLDFLIRNEFGSSVVGNQFTTSSVLFTDITGAISKRHENFRVDSLVDFETADFTNVTSAADNRADIRNLGDHTSNGNITTNKLSLQASQRKDFLFS